MTLGKPLIVRGFLIGLVRPFKAKTRVRIPLGTPLYVEQFLTAVQSACRFHLYVHNQYSSNNGYGANPLVSSLILGHQALKHLVKIEDNGDSAWFRINRTFDHQEATILCHVVVAPIA